MVAAIMSSLTDTCRSVEDCREAVLVLVHHWFYLVCDVVEIDSDGLLVKKVEALNTHLGVLGDYSVIGHGTPFLW